MGLIDTNEVINLFGISDRDIYAKETIEEALCDGTLEITAEPEQHGRIFQEIVVEYPSISTYPEYEGKPYFSIKYVEDGQGYIGYGTYNSKVLSEYLKEYFIQSAQPEQGCDECVFKPFKQFQPERWIPCSERLPENGHYYLWCSDMGSVQSDYYWDGFENGMKYGYNIVAWMPLPEPYRGE